MNTPIAQQPWQMRLLAKAASVYIKIAAGFVGLAATVVWYLSAMETASALALRYNALLR